MKRFRNILVGVDLSKGDRFVSSELSPPSAEAVARALWLAKMNSARLTFFYTLDVSVAAQRMIEEWGDGDPTVISAAKEVLNELVSRARADGVAARMDVRFGTSWLEIIRQVLRENHDLVVAGTRHLGALKSFLMGSTGIKLLRKCPCPVWITQPQPEKQITSILIAHGLRTVGDFAMELGCSMAELHGARLHVLHSLELSELESVIPANAFEEKVVQERSNAEQHINAQLSNYAFAHPPQIHIVSAAPDLAVLKHLEMYGIELLVMGTIARTGIAGFITGSTAERLLPQIPCSILAVKPPGFISPVSV